MSPSAIDALRRAGKIEGLSFLVLLLVAMPLKYLADRPLAVTVVGWIHGMLFVWFCWVLANARRHGGLSWRLTSLAFIASLLPLGPFVVDHRLRAAEESRRVRPDD